MGDHDEVAPESCEDNQPPANEIGTSVLVANAAGLTGKFSFKIYFSPSSILDYTFSLINFR